MTSGALFPYCSVFLLELSTKKGKKGNEREELRGWEIELNIFSAKRMKSLLKIMGSGASVQIVALEGFHGLTDWIWGVAQLLLGCELV